MARRVDRSNRWREGGTRTVGKHHRWTKERLSVPDEIGCFESLPTSSARLPRRRRQPRLSDISHISARFLRRDALVVLPPLRECSSVCRRHILTQMRIAECFDPTPIGEEAQRVAGTAKETWAVRVSRAVEWQRTMA